MEKDIKIIYDCKVSIKFKIKFYHITTLLTILHGSEY